MSYIGWCITAILSKWPKLVVPCVRNLVPCPFDPNHCCNWWYGKVSFYKMLTPAYFQASILVSWRGGFSVPERSAPSWDSPHSFPCHFALCEPVARWHSARWVAARCLWALEVHSCCSTSRQKNGSFSKVSCKVFRKTNYKQLGSHQVTTCSQILKEQGSRCSRCSLLVLPPILCLQLCLSVGYSQKLMVNCWPCYIIFACPPCFKQPPRTPNVFFPHVHPFSRGLNHFKSLYEIMFATKISICCYSYLNEHFHC